MLSHICLDMDGVIADFQRAALWAFGWMVDEDNGCEKGAKLTHVEGKFGTYPWGDWNIHTAIGVTEQEFWDRLHGEQNFFSTLSPTRDALAIIGRIKRSGVPFTICTSPSRDSRDATAKIDWMRAVLLEPHFRDYMVGPNKPLFAKPDVLLIDDSPKNVAAFEAAGGRTLLWPQYWNASYRLRNQKLTVLDATLKNFGV